MRRVKSPSEVEALKKAWAICDIGYKAVLDADIVGLTEIQAAAIAEKAARDAGAEAIIFSLFTAGEKRTNIVVGRASENVIKRGDMIMFAFAVQYQGYIATNQCPIRWQEPTKSKNFLEFSWGWVLGWSFREGFPRESSQTNTWLFCGYGLSKYDLFPQCTAMGSEAESPIQMKYSRLFVLAGTSLWRESFDPGLVLTYRGRDLYYRDGLQWFVPLN